MDHRFIFRRLRTLICKVQIVAAGVIGLGLGACVDTSSPGTLSSQGFCEEQASVQCEKYYTCLSEAERLTRSSTLLAEGQDIGTTQSACSQNLKGLCVTKPFKCEAGQTFQEMKAFLCADSLQRLSCQDWAAGRGELIGCDKVCAPTIGGN